MRKVADRMRRVALMDGGHGEELFRRGLPDDRKTWSAAALEKQEFHALSKQIFVDFINAGARFITTNNYAVTPGCSFTTEKMQRLCSLAGRLAREAVTECGISSVHVLGSLPPLVESYRPDLVLAHEQGVAHYKVISESLEPYVDGFIAETLSSIEEMHQAVDALNTGPGLRCDVYCSWTLSSHGSLRSGESPSLAAKWLVEYCQSSPLRLKAILFNCCEPAAIDLAMLNLKEENILSLLRERGIKLGAYPNRLTPISSTWTMEGSETAQPIRTDLTPSDFAALGQRWADDGIDLIGGCCAITPQHVAALAQRLRKNCILED